MHADICSLASARLRSCALCVVSLLLFNLPFCCGVACCSVRGPMPKYKTITENKKKINLTSTLPIQMIEETIYNNNFGIICTFLRSDVNGIECLCGAFFYFFALSFSTTPLFFSRCTRNICRRFVQLSICSSFCFFLFFASGNNRLIHSHQNCFHKTNALSDRIDLFYFV